VTTADFEYDPADEYGDGDFRQVIEFRDAPDLDLDDNRYATQQGEIDTVETDDGWGTPVLHAAVQHVEDDDLVGWEYPTLGTIATAEKVTDGEVIRPETATTKKLSTRSNGRRGFLSTKYTNCRTMENSSYHMLRNEARLRTRKRWSALAASGFARIEQRVNT